jgi:hypothetical protein
MWGGEMTGIEVFEVVDVEPTGETDFLAWLEDYQDKLGKGKNVRPHDSIGVMRIANLYWQTASTLALAQQLSRIASALEEIVKANAEDKDRTERLMRRSQELAKEMREMGWDNL